MLDVRTANFQGKASFAIGTGRCGTTFLAKVVACEPEIASSHERFDLNETFHRYCKWYGLPVDSEGFLKQKEIEIMKDLEEYPHSFESSPHLALSLPELYERFKAKFIFLVRSPEDVVNSFLDKGWYDKPGLLADVNGIPSYQLTPRFQQFLARIMPRGEKFSQWNQMSQVGKVAWYWNAYNARILADLQDKIPSSHWRIQHLEELNYNRYVELVEFMGFVSKVDRATYDKIASSRPNARPNPPSVHTWNLSEWSEFEAEVQPVAERLGYPYRRSVLLEKQTKPSHPKPKSLISYLRATFAVRS